MRILIDTNILISAILFPNSKPARAVMLVSNEHEMVLCEQNLSELRNVAARKTPQLLPAAEVLLTELAYELIPATYHAEKLIRDPKDQPILNAAIVSHVDLIITGDRDILSLNMEHPRCISATLFLDEFSEEG